MEYKEFNYQKVKKKYLKFLTSQEVTSEPFRDKLGQLKKFYLPISKIINDEHEKKNKTQVVGLTGGQGTGKSTISNILKIILKEAYNLETVIFSIDDFYKTLKDRKIMSKKISDLFLTRGVPGTHDTKILFHCIKKLKISKFKKINIPKFDKSIDDRMKKKNWYKIKKKPDIVILEGWCVGAPPQNLKNLKNPINSLEKKFDKKSVWRKYVNQQLNNKYKTLYKLIDCLLYIKAKDFSLLRKWRLKQEKKLYLNTKRKKNLKIMSKDQVLNFMMTYQRITEQMFKETPKYASVVMTLNKHHQIRNIKYKK